MTRIWPWLILLVFVVASNGALAQTNNAGKIVPILPLLLFEDPIPRRILNDTGITWGGDYPSGNNLDCTSNILGGAPQDCHQGRDATHNDSSDGHGGFSFTKLDSNGNPLPTGATTWYCVKDNITGLIWELKQNLDDVPDGGNVHDADNTYRWGGKTALGSGYGTYYSDWNTLVDSSNNANFCGYRNWRVPTTHELEGLLHLGRSDPAIDTFYFPDTPSSNFWSASPGAYNSGYAWFVLFNNGTYGMGQRHGYKHVRLVRSGP